jgi:protein-disulfide isomerase
VAGSLVAFVGLLAAIHVEPPKEIPVAELVASVNSGPVLPVKLDEGLPSFGPANAAVTIVEFSDFQCPHCRKGAMFMHSLLNMYPRDLRVVFRNFPLDAKCNRGMQGGGGHQAACEAAKSVICAKEQGHESFKHQYETLFERQPEIASGKPTLFAKEAGLDMTKFESCMSSREADAKVAADVEEGINLGLRSTPTFFINGRKVEGAYPVEVWRILIDQLMTSARHAGG